MKKGKKAQGSIVAIVIIIIILIILIALLAMFLINPGIFSIGTTGSAVKTTGNLVCNSPYIQVGNSCCLDQNYNSICDKDETSTTSPTTVTITPTTPEVTCSLPYIKRNNACCLDEDGNGICDKDELSSSGSIYRTRRASIDDPFHISNIELIRDTISFRLKNDGDKDIIVKLIDIDDCGSDNFERQLDAGERKTFDVDCDDRLTHIDSDMTIRYMEVGSNVTKSSDGTIEIDKRTYL